LADYGLEAFAGEVKTFFEGSSLLEQKGMLDLVSMMTVQGTRVSFGSKDVNSYMAAVLVDFIRTRLVTLGETVSFETVMSGPSIAGQTLGGDPVFGPRLYLGQLRFRLGVTRRVRPR
ncbi:MAG: hypothetical protein ACLGIN_02400, partial [Candidatus Sericytochromatia bacterium]